MILIEVEQMIAEDFIFQNKWMPRLALREVALSLDRQNLRENLNDVMTLKIVSLMEEITFICF